jgi:hypothetical protein
MSYNKSDYTVVMNRPDSEWTKYGSAQNFEKVINHQLKNQFIPSKVSLLRAIKELGLRRVDGGSAASDARAAQAAAQKNFDDVCAEVKRIPLTPEFLSEIASLDQISLSRRYFEDSTDGIIFRLRYDRACQEFGYRPAQRFAEVTAEQDDGEALELTPQAYHSMSANVIIQRLRTDAPFKRAVNALIAKGLIALLLFITTYAGVA